MYNYNIKLSSIPDEYFTKINEIFNIDIKNILKKSSKYDIFITGGLLTNLINDKHITDYQDLDIVCPDKNILFIGLLLYKYGYELISPQKNDVIYSLNGMTYQDLENNNSKDVIDTNILKNNTYKNYEFNNIKSEQILNNIVNVYKFENKKKRQIDIISIKDNINNYITDSIKSYKKLTEEEVFINNYENFIDYIKVFDLDICRNLMNLNTIATLKDYIKDSKPGYMRLCTFNKYTFGRLVKYLNRGYVLDREMIKIDKNNYHKLFLTEQWNYWKRCTICLHEHKNCYLTTNNKLRNNKDSKNESNNELDFTNSYYIHKEYNKYSDNKEFNPLDFYDDTYETKNLHK
jgi:hypothetical protein